MAAAPPVARQTPGSGRNTPRPSRFLDRAYGKPRPNADKEPSLEDRLAAMSPQERRARLAELTEKARKALQQDNVYAVIEVEEVGG
jgi:hypothetical protein